MPKAIRTPMMHSTSLARPLSGKAGEFRFEVSVDATMLHGDTDGDGNADIAIKFDTVLSLRERDFVP